METGDHSLNIYRISVTTVGLIAFAMLTAVGGLAGWQSAIFFLLLATAATLVPIQLPQAVLTVATAITVAVYLLLGPVMALWVSVLANVLGHGIGHKRPVATILFNVGQLSLSLVSAHAVFNAAGGEVVRGPASAGVWQNFVPLLFFLAIYFVVNNGLVLLYFSFRTGTPISELARETVPWSAFNHVVSVVVGLVLLFAFADYGLSGALMVFVPLIVLGYLMSLQIGLSQAHDELQILYDAALKLNAAITLEEVFRLVHETMRKIGPVDDAILYLLDSDAETLVSKTGILSSGEDLQELRYKLGQGIVGAVAATRQPEMVNDVQSDPRFDPRPLQGIVEPSSAMLLAPLVVEGDLLGVLVIANSHERRYEERQLRIVSILGNLVGVALQNAILYERTEKLAVTDALTGLHNYRFFRTKIAEELRKARLTDGTVALIYLDIDDFKQYNDRYGHTWGDQLLRGFADILNDAVRSTDTPIRYAGDEFAVILPDASRQQAQIVMNRIMEQVAKTSFRLRDNVRVTLSVSSGIAVFPEDAHIADELIIKADQAMYTCKETREPAN